jgi:integrase/recombinase XerD
MSFFPESLEAHRRVFLEALRVRNYSPSTLAQRSQSLSIFFRFLASKGVDDLREVSRDLVREYQGFITSGSYKSSSICTHLQSLKVFYEHLEKTDVVLINPCGGLVLPRRKKQLPENVLTREEVKKLLNAPNTQTRLGIRNKAILELFYSTGIRLEEMARLQVLDVDFRSGFLRVNKGKGAKDRVVPMGSRAVYWVREYLRQVRILWGRQRPEERAMWLSCKGPHRAIKSQNIEVMIKNHACAVGFKKRVTPHTWRHTCATHMVANGANVVYVQKLLGHRSIRSTNIYTRVRLPEVKASHRRNHPSARRKDRKSHEVVPEARPKWCRNRMAIYRRSRK